MTSLEPSGFRVASANTKYRSSQLPGGKLTTLGFPILVGAVLCPHRRVAILPTALLPDPLCLNFGNV